MRRTVDLVVRYGAGWRWLQRARTDSAPLPEQRLEPPAQTVRAARSAAPRTYPEPSRAHPTTTRLATTLTALGARFGRSTRQCALADARCGTYGTRCADPERAQVPQFYEAIRPNVT